MAERLEVELSAKIGGFVRGMKDAAKETLNTEKAITKSVNGISNAITSNFAGLFSIAAITGFTKQVISVTSEFEKFNAVLGNTLGSASLASIKLKEIQEFAERTPFGIQELTASFVKLANGGFKPTGDQMRALGDLASSTGKSFDQLAEAILDAQTGEFERLKEFGIRAKDAGDSVIFTYKGVQTQVEKTSGSIRDYITNLGNAQGVSGSMAKISATLGGQISNLGDTWDKMLLSVGGNTTGVFNSAISVISKTLDKITQYNNELNIASKYKLGNTSSDFISQLNRAINPFASKGPTQIELSTFNINEASKNVQKFVSDTLAAAKSTEDFGKALADLKKQGDQALKAPFIQSEEERRAIKDQYQLGVKAIQDARAALNNTPQSDANFGKGTEKKVKNLSTVLKELEQDLTKVGVLFGAGFEEKNAKQVDAYQKAIESLIDLGYKPASKEIQNLINKQKELNILQEGKTFADRPADRGPLGGRLIGQASKGIQINTPTVEEEYYRLLALQERFNKEFSGLVEDGFLSTVSNIGTSIGEALANGGNVFEAIGSSILDSFSSFLSDFGDLLVKYGAAAILKGKLDLAVAVPGAGIVAGAALVAAGIALKVAAGAVSSLASGRSSDNGREPRRTAFATGGVVSGPTNALIGEYPGARTNPEVVAPLDKLNSLISRSISRTLASGLSGLLSGGGSRYMPNAMNIRAMAGETQLTLRVVDEGIRGENIVRAYDLTTSRWGRI